MIGQPFRLVGKLLLFLADGKGCECLGNLPGVQVDERRLAGSSQIVLRFLPVEEGQVGHRVARGPGKREAQDQHAEEDQKRKKPTPAKHALQCCVLLVRGAARLVAMANSGRLPTAGGRPR